MKQLTDKCFAVEVPDGAKLLHIETDLDGKPYLAYKFKDDELLNEYELMYLEAGNYRFLFTTKTATEEDAKKVVGSSEWFFPVRHTRYIDYAHPYDTDNKQKWSFGFGIALESLHSLLRSKGLDPDKNIAIIEKLSSDADRKTT